MKKSTYAIAIIIAATIPRLGIAADAQRQAEVAARSKDVMPFALKATTHIFTKTGKGGIQRVVAKNIADPNETKLVRLHLHEIRQQFLNGDFSGPSHIHGMNMPGLSELRSAKQTQLAIDYRDVAGGAELTYRTSNSATVAALHKWFDAQLSDHGADAAEGHQNHHGVSRKD